jgi:hypothetical protein
MTWAIGFKPKARPRSIKSVEGNIVMSHNDSSVATSDFAFLREEIRHEDNLINQRLSWLVSSQSFLLTGFAIALNGPLQARFPQYERLNLVLMSLIPVVGVVICLVSYLTIFAGVLHMRQIRRLAGTFGWFSWCGRDRACERVGVD